MFHLSEHFKVPVLILLLIESESHAHYEIFLGEKGMMTMGSIDKTIVKVRYNWSLYFMFNNFPKVRNGAFLKFGGNRYNCSLRPSID